MNSEVITKFHKPAADGFTLLRQNTPRLTAGMNGYVEFRHHYQDTPCRSTRSFTLIEVLVALVVLTIVVSAALESQIMSIKMERAVSAAHAVRFEIDRILVQTCLGHAETNITEAGTPDCNIFWKPVRIKSHTEPFETFSPVARDLSEGISADMVRWEIVPKERPSFKTAVFTHRVLQ